MSTTPCFRGACDRPAHPACWNAMTHGFYCLSCAREIQAHEDGTIKPLFPFLAALRESPAFTTYLFIEQKPTRVEARTPQIREFFATADMLATELTTIYPTREKVRSRAQKLTGTLWRLRLAVLGEAKP